MFHCEPRATTVQELDRVSELSKRLDMKGYESTTLSAYKRTPSLENSTWYKGILVSQMAGTSDNDGAFDLVVSKMRRGTEPPPHVHSREHEVFYILSGAVIVYVDDKVFRVSTGEFMFLPRGVPHAFLLESDEVHQLALVTPGGFFDAVNRMNSPAERLEVPTDADTITYANADLTQTIELFEQYGLRFLTAEEISTTMPDYPMRTPAAAR
jgi:quercetin dioxygenase-like cupin family protein